MASTDQTAHATKQNADFFENYKQTQYHKTVSTTLNQIIHYINTDTEACQRRPEFSDRFAGFNFITVCDELQGE